MFIAKEGSAPDKTPHLQGACILMNQMSLSALKRMSGFQRAHIETMLGTVEDNIKYCSKEDTEPYESGSRPVPGKRNDLKEACELIHGGASISDLSKDLDTAPCVVKFYKGLTIIRNFAAPDRVMAPVVYWFHGPTGIGKTRLAVQLAGQLGLEAWMSNGSLSWFDGYDNQCVAILDDFRSQHSTFSYLLRVLDRYPLRVPFKGGFVRWLPLVIFVTAPKDPSATYAGKDDVEINQLLRRITKIVNFASDDLDLLDGIENRLYHVKYGGEEKPDEMNIIDSDSDSVEEKWPKPMLPALKKQRNYYDLTKF